MHTHQSKNTGKTGWLITVIVISLCLCTTIQAQDTTQIPVWIPDSVSKNVRDYNEIIKKIYAIVDKDIRIIQAGSVSYNAAVYPVFALVYTPPVQPAVRVFLAGGQHGDEPASADAIINFFQYISSHKSLYQDVAVDAIPMINPYGWVKNTRTNGSRQDINRDYKRFVSQEAKIVRNFVQGRQYDYMIDHHESKGDGAFIYNYNADMFEICNELMNFLRADGYGIGVHGYFIDRTLINGIMDIPSMRRNRNADDNQARESYWSENSIIVRYFTSGLARYGFTMETSSRKLYKDRVQCHFEVMRFMITAFRDLAP